MSIKRHAPRKAPGRKHDERRRNKSRYYRTNSTTWRGIRAAHLARHPLCEYCLIEEPPRLTPARVVDHFYGDTSDNSEAALIACCDRCHNAKTARFDMGQGLTHKQVSEREDIYLRLMANREKQNEEPDGGVIPL